MVYEAEDSERDELVALKTLRHVDSESLYRLKQEFRALADLQHPNLVTLYDLIVEEGIWLFTMELVRGADFTAYCGRDTAAPGQAPLDETRLRPALRQLVEGVHALHEAGKLHRDLKPSNVMVTATGRVVILDFGFAVELDDERRGRASSAAIVGTADYMAPEQARSVSTLGPAADWYSVGALLYHTLTGAPPFEGAPLDVLLRKQEQLAPPPSARVSGVPADLDELCVQLLAIDPAERPSGEEVLTRLARASRPSLPRPRTFEGSARGAFVGRDLELERLTRAVTRSRQHAAAAVIEGDTGIGKSALIDELLARLRLGDGAAVTLRGRCYGRESVPYKAIDQVIDQLSQMWRSLPPREAAALIPRDTGNLTRLFPVLDRVPAVAKVPRTAAPKDPQERRTRGFAALRELLERTAERHPVVIVLDDAQWLDADTITLLADVLRPPEPPRILLLVARRGSDAPPSRAALAFARVLEQLPGGVEHLELPGMSVEAVRALATEALGEVDPATIARVVAESAGSPLFALELARYLNSTERGHVALSLDEVLRARVSALGSAAHRVLELACVAGEPTSRRAIADAAQLDFRELSRHVERLASARLLRTTGSRRDDTIEPNHDRIRDAVLNALAPEVMREHHRALAVALQSWSDGGAQRLARHWHGAGDRSRAAQHAMQAADEAATQLDFDRAADLFRFTLSLDEQPAATDRALRIALAEALGNAGRSEEAALSFLDAARAEEEPSARLELQRRAADLFLKGGYLTPGLAAVQAVIDDVGMKLPRTTRGTVASLAWAHARLSLRPLRWRPRAASELAPAELRRVDVCWSLASGLAMVDSWAGALFSTRGMLLALAAGEPTRISRALAAAAMASSALGWRRQSQRFRQAAHRIADADGSELVRFYATSADFTTAFLERCDWREALAGAKESARLWRAAGHGQGWELDIANQFACWSLLFLGELRELNRRVPAHVREAQRVGNRFLEVSLRCYFAQLDILDDRPGDARRDVAAALASWLPDGREFLNQHYWALVCRSMAALYLGDVEQRADELEVGWARMRSSGLARVAFFRTEAEWTQGRLCLALANAAGARGDGEAKAAYLHKAGAHLRTLSRQRLPMAAALAPLLRAGCEQLAERPEHAIAALRVALQQCNSLAVAPLVAAIELRLGVLLGGQEGTELDQRAHRWMSAAGARCPERFGAMLVAGWSHPG